MRRLNGLDAIFLAAEGPAKYLTHTMAVMVLDPSTMPDGDRVEAVRTYIGERIHLVPPLQRCLVEVPLGLDAPRWIDGVHVDLDHHIQGARLPLPATAAELAGFVSDLAGRRLDRRYPLWEMYVVDGFEGGRLCIVAKLHHSLMDGGAGMQFMASLFDLDPASPAPEAPEHVARDRRPGTLAMVARSLGPMCRRPVIGARAVHQTLGAAVRVGRELVDRRQRGGGPLAVPFAAPTLQFNARITSRREIAFASLSLTTIKDVAHGSGVTVNDVVLATVAGALRRFLLASGTLPEKSLVAAVPVSVRGDHGVEQSNMFSVMLTRLATDLDDPADRLAAIHDGTHEAKLLQSAMGSEALTEWIEFPIPAIFTFATALYSRMHLSALHPPMCNVLVSDVQGPPVAMYFARARLESIFPLGPIFDGMGLNITAVSSPDTLDVGVVACPDQLPGLWHLVDGLAPALEELHAPLLARSRAPSPALGRTTRRPTPVPAG